MNEYYHPQHYCQHTLTEVSKTNGANNVCISLVATISTAFTRVSAVNSIHQHLPAWYHTL